MRKFHPDVDDCAAGVAKAGPTIFDVLACYGDRQPDQPAILASGCRVLSFADLIALIESIWKILNDGGVGRGSKVGIALPSGPEAAITIVAIASKGTCIPVNPHLTQSELQWELNRLNLDALIVPSWNEPLAAKAADPSCALFTVSKVDAAISSFDLRCLRSARVRQRAVEEISAQSVALVLRTSGTTASSKLVPVTHQNLLDLTSKLLGWWQLSNADRAACVLPTYYAAGSKLNVLAPLLLGEGIAIPMAGHPERLTEWIFDLRPTWFFSGPTFLQAVLDGFRSHRERLAAHSLRFIACGTAHLPDQVRTELEDMLRCPIIEMYGMSEAGIIAANPAPPAKRKFGTAGLVTPNEVVIRGGSGEILPRGEVGEIFVGGPSVMPGYLDDPQPVGAGLQDGWLPTGDLGSIDSDGFLTIHGRIKEMISRGAEKISPYEVEIAMLSHPAVREAAVFPVPHPRLGENVAAAVVLKPGNTLTQLELKNFLRESLAAFKLPSHIEIVDSIPRSDNGKVLRRVLADSIINRPRFIEPPDKDIEFQIADIWKRLLRRSDIGIDDDFVEAGGDSLLAAQMLLEVEAAVGHAISPSVLVQASTIRELAAIVVRDFGAEDTKITKIKDGIAAPFFFCHGDHESGGLYARRLAASIKADASVYLIHPTLNFDDTSEISLEGMAQERIPHLLEIYPTGRFRLGGYCNGGLLAWELAHQLAQRGREVDSITLIEVISLNARSPFRLLHRITPVLARISPSKYLAGRFRLMMSVAWTMAHDVDDELPQPPSVRGNRLFYWRFISLGLRKVCNLMTMVLQSEDRRRLAVQKKVPSFLKLPPYQRAMANYLPPKLHCFVNVIVCEKNAETVVWCPSLWRRLTQSTRWTIVPGDHRTCVTEHVAALAQLMNASLE